jgi:hypothetical protein
MGLFLRFVIKHPLLCHLEDANKATRHTAKADPLELIGGSLGTQARQSHAGFHRLTSPSEAPRTGRRGSFGTSGGKCLRVAALCSLVETIALATISFIR